MLYIQYQGHLDLVLTNQKQLIVVFITCLQINDKRFVMNRILSYIMNYDIMYLYLYLPITYTNDAHLSASPLWPFFLFFYILLGSTFLNRQKCINSAFDIMKDTLTIWYSSIMLIYTVAVWRILQTLLYLLFISHRLYNNNNKLSIADV